MAAYKQRYLSLMQKEPIDWQKDIESVFDTPASYFSNIFISTLIKYFFTIIHIYPNKPNGINILCPFHRRGFIIKT